MRVVKRPAKKAADVQEMIISLSISYINKTAEIGTAEVLGDDENGEPIPDVETIRYATLRREEYAQLMKARKGKAKNEFKEADLWAALDQHAERQS